MYWTLNGPEYEQCNNFTLMNKVELYTTIDRLMLLFKLYNPDVQLLIGFLTLSFIDFGTDDLHNNLSFTLKEQLLWLNNWPPSALRKWNTDLLLTVSIQQQKHECTCMVVVTLQLYIYLDWHWRFVISSLDVKCFMQLKKYWILDKKVIRIDLWKRDSCTVFFICKLELPISIVWIISIELNTKPFTRLTVKS